MRFAESLVALPYRRFCGRVVQGYRIEALIGIGGSGVVFKAISPDGAPVALKLLRPVRATYDLAAVWREVEPLARLTHRAVPEWQGILRDGRAYFVVLSWMPGDSLVTWLFEKRHTFGAQERNKICQQLLDALEVLHAAGLSHGDLRPANILYDGNQISLVDFGLSLQEESCCVDVAGFADVLLYLLYSAHDAKPAAKKQPLNWQEELILSPQQRALLDQSFQEPCAFAAHDLQQMFTKAFAVQE